MELLSVAKNQTARVREGFQPVFQAADHEVGGIGRQPIIPDLVVERMWSGASDQNLSNDGEIARSDGGIVMPAEAGIQSFRIPWIPAENMRE